ncbi:hypothetical protein DFQ04_1913 [Algoriphagus boseongensis]|uniref:DUF4136 domain-containing protein n=1 Tax=Algoriphagus boseongensis TaxID=1442587 RepID=A0A4R6T467_9BACT|nr:hypothetical protein [Algoriphagus boseongensis]TDQ17261.1 hypothetical protein DFQ04_1913 [Algoriphagus boseongensis]
MTSETANTSFKIILVAVLLFFGSSPLFAQSSWKSPTYQKEEYRKVIVLAKTTNPGAKRMLEDETVAELQANGIQAIPAYANFSEEDLKSEQTFLAKAEQLEADALLVYTFNNPTTEYKNSPTVSATVGVPVRVGIFSGFLGTSVPVAGGPKQVQKFSGSVLFYNKQGPDMQWSLDIGGKIGSDTSKQARSVAKNVVKAALGDDLF